MGLLRFLFPRVVISGGALSMDFGRVLAARSG